MDSFIRWLGADTEAGWDWFWVFVFPLLLAGAVALGAVLTQRAQGSKYVEIASDDKGVQLPVRLTFLGAAVAAIAQFDMFTKNTEVAPDVGVLLMANVVFAGLAASNGLMEGFPKVEKETRERLRTGVVLWASIGSLLAAGVLICRVPADLIPGWVKILLSAMVAVAVLAVCAYERNRLQAAAEPSEDSSKKTS